VTYEKKEQLEEEEETNEYFGIVEKEKENTNPHIAKAPKKPRKCKQINVNKQVCG